METEGQGEKADMEVGSDEGVKVRQWRRAVDVTDCEETDDTKKGRWEMRGEEMKCVEERWHEEDRLYWGKEIE